MDTNSTESTVTTKSTELISKNKRKRERKKARKQREDLMLKDGQATRNEESSVEDVACLKKSELDIDANAQLLTLGHPEIEKESVECLPRRVGKSRRRKMRRMKEMNDNAEPFSMGHNDALSTPGLSDNKHVDVDATAQLLPQGHPEIEKELSDNKHGDVDVAQLLPQGHPEIEKELSDNKHGDVDATAQLLPQGHPGIEKEPSDNKHVYVDTTAQLLPQGHPEIEKELADGLPETKSAAKKRRKKSRMKAMNNNTDPSSMGLNDVLLNPGLSDNKHGDVDATAQLLPQGHPEIEKELPDNKHGDVDATAQLLPQGHPEIEKELSDNKHGDVDATAQLLPQGRPEIEKELADGLPETKSAAKRRRKKSRMKAMNNNTDPSSMGQNDVLSNPGLSDDEHGDVDATVQLLPLGHPEIEKELADGLPETKSAAQRRRKKSRMKVMNNNTDPSGMGQNDVLSNPGLSDDKHGDVDATAQLLPLGHPEIEKELADGLPETKSAAKKRRKKSRMKAMNNNTDPSSMGQDDVLSNPGLLDDKHGEVENVLLNPNSASISPRGLRLRRKLLILDLNGLLADIIHPPPKECNPDARFDRRAIFKRPYCDDFLQFCFAKFDVAVWSSRSNKIFVKVVDYLFGKLKHKLLFCWDMNHSTQTNFKTLDNMHKPLVFKELRKVWDKYDPNLPWERGDYDESNTLLLDDSPYKALLNPPNTAIFPTSYNYKAENDNSLGPEGDLRIYLEGLFEAENVQKYVEQHPFGQRAIDETSSDWDFYSDVLDCLHCCQSDKDSSVELDNLEVKPIECYCSLGL